MSDLYTKGYRIGRRDTEARLAARIEALEAALEGLYAFVAVMVGQGPNAAIPETVQTPLGVSVKIGDIMHAARAALAPEQDK